jgi:hypothetical protein
MSNLRKLWCKICKICPICKIRKYAFKKYIHSKITHRALRLFLIGLDFSSSMTILMSHAVPGGARRRRRRRRLHPSPDNASEICAELCQSLPSSARESHHHHVLALARLHRWLCSVANLLLRGRALAKQAVDFRGKLWSVGTRSYRT